jgi:hypothetical protein
MKKTLAGEIAELAFEWEFNDVAVKACEFVIADTWDPKSAWEMILAQAKCHFQIAQVHIDLLTKRNFEVAFEEPVMIDSEEETKPLSEDEQQGLLKQKRQILAYYSRGLQLAKSIGQHWLVFNGAIYIWNNFLPIFRNPSNNTRLLPEMGQLIKAYFDAMQVSLKELEKRQISDYDIDTKIQVFANIGLICARLAEQTKQFEEVGKICEALLLTPLSPHTRKLINSIKARNLPGRAPQKDKGKGEKAPASGNTDSFLFDIVSQL